MGLALILRGKRDWNIMVKADNRLKKYIVSINEVLIDSLP